MPRPVEGYVTRQGNFFATKNEAELFEATYDLREAYSAFWKDYYNGAPVLSNDWAAFTRFVTDHAETIQAYLEAKRTQPVPAEPTPSRSEESDEDNGPAPSDPA